MLSTFDLRRERSKHMGFTPEASQNAASETADRVAWLRLGQHGKLGVHIGHSPKGDSLYPETFRRSGAVSSLQTNAFLRPGPLGRHSVATEAPRLRAEGLL